MAQEIDGTGDLTSGAYEKPTATDSGSKVFNILETFMERMAGHKHEGTDSLLINKKLDKTPYTVSGESWSSPDANGNKYVTITITDEDHYLRAGDTVLDITREFYYLKDTLDSSSGAGHIRFYPDLVWTNNNVVQVHTNIHETIASDSATAADSVVIMKVY